MVTRDRLLHHVALVECATASQALCAARAVFEARLIVEKFKPDMVIDMPLHEFEMELYRQAERRETITSIETTITWLAAALNALSHPSGSIADVIRCHARAVAA
jgi:hypothetical protein